MTEDKDDSPDSKKTCRISTDNITTKPSLLSSPSTLGFFCDRDTGGTVQNVAMARIHNRPSIGLSCW
jgi:hypothetical protein